MSVLTRGTFREDGYADGVVGKVPSPPDACNGSSVLAAEYMEGWQKGNGELELEKARSRVKAGKPLPGDVEIILRAHVAARVPNAAMMLKIHVVKSDMGKG